MVILLLACSDRKYSKKIFEDLKVDSWDQISKRPK